jgi:hypothetical protein
VAAEAVISVLIENFRFYPSGKDIYWQMSIVTFPTVGKSSQVAELPLVVEKICV